MFVPERVIFEPQALDYPLGDRLYRQFHEQGLELGFASSHNRITGIPGRTRPEKFFRAKRTLVVGVRRSKEFTTCRPSAHYQLPLATGCPGLCEYCYLLTNLSRSPYIRIYVNLEEILDQAAVHIGHRLPDTTVFEGAATSDPLAVEPYSGSLARAIEFFAGQPRGHFRFVTKFDDVDSLLTVRHGGATRFRFSVNTEAVIRRFEHGTPSLPTRLAAARQVAEAGYPLGFMIAPIVASGSTGAERRTSGNGGADNPSRDGRSSPDMGLETSRGSQGQGRRAASSSPWKQEQTVTDPIVQYDATGVVEGACSAPGDAEGSGIDMSTAAYDAADWEAEYGSLFRELAAFADIPDLTFELITHRFTARAKCAIQELFPRTRLPLEETERRFQWGQFGYGKYVFQPELRQRVETFFRSALATHIPKAHLEYFV